MANSAKTCPKCGVPMAETGPPIWGIYCPNKACSSPMENLKEAIRMNIISRNPPTEHDERGRELLAIRDRFIVSKGLWDEFVSQLPNLKEPGNGTA